MINKFLEKKSLSFLEVKIKNKSISNLSRPKNLKSVLKNFKL